MKCVVLAAGFGSRLKEVADSKPLVPIGGVPLIEHVLRRAAAAGATQFLVVTGHEGDRLEAYLGNLEARFGLTIEAVRCVEYDRPNGFSVLAAASRVEGPYLLLMADHLFDPQVVKSLLDAPQAGAGVTLVVDRDLAGPLLDLDDATKVQVGEGGRIVRIGKSLARYDAIDTGIFLATPALADAIRAVVAEGGAGSLSEGVQRLADAGQAATLDIGADRWIDVDNAHMLRLAEALVSDRSAG